jgi:hypothetical protein
MIKALMVTLLMAGAAPAETLTEAYGLGDAAPNPEEWTKIDGDLSIRARILRDATGALADVVTRPEVLRVAVEFHAREGAADRPVRLVCSAMFYDAEGEGSDYVFRDKPCYEGRLADAAGQFRAVDFGLKIRPVATDPAGTSAVVVTVRDLVIDDGVSLAPTYDWQGGR